VKPDEIGTRYNHYHDLLELWETGIEVVKGYKYPSKTDKERLTQLEAGVFLLRKQIDILCRYESGQYSDALLPLKRQVDRISKDPDSIA
jgi:hypothetical protein